MSVVVSRLAVYPVKSLDPLELREATLLPSGCLAGDRRFALVDEAGEFVNGKRERKVHTVRTRYDEGGVSGLLWFGESPEPDRNAYRFDLASEPTGIAQRLSAYLGYRVRIAENADSGFPDDTQASGPTIVSTETLLELGDLIDVPLAELRRRFRANIEVHGGGELYEDRAFGPTGTLVPLRIGEAKLFGENPCRRCAVPGRDSWTGETHPGFAKSLATWREATIGEDVHRDRFAGDWFRLALNTRPVSNAEPQRIAVGDSVEIAGAPVSQDEALGGHR